MSTHLAQSQALQMTKRRIRSPRDCRVRDYSEFIAPSQELLARFWSKVEKGDGCWMWRGTIRGKGYGAFHLRDKMFVAHRVSYVLETGNLATGLELDHLCRNRGCVNPAHLQAVTTGENLRRSPLTFNGRNASKSFCIRGHDLAEARVSTDKFGRVHRTCQECITNALRGVCRFCGKSLAQVARHERHYCRVRHVMGGQA